MGVLDYLGDIGGYMGAIEMIFIIIGSFFSEKFLAVTIASKFYKHRTQLEQESE